jgi:RHS repeat-associated protein
VQADGVYYVHADHLATPRSIVKASNGVEIWRWDSEPFGATSPTNPNPASGGLGYNVRFAGQYRDVESGVVYNGMRDYLPATGRYLQADPIGLRGGLARYGYAVGNPLSWIDPSGLVGFDGAFWGHMAEVVHDGAIRLGARFGAYGVAFVGGYWVGEQINATYVSAYGQDPGGLLFDRYGPNIPEWQPRLAPIELWDIPIPQWSLPGKSPAPLSCPR